MPLAQRSNASCHPKPKSPRTIALPVLASPSSVLAGSGGDRNAWSPGHTTIKHSRAGRWRALSLILIHVVFAIHIAQWLITGLTISPIEPSESMYTLRDGLVNAGFVFFILAIVSTLLFGRFFCGWGCHIVAVQDFCAWIMMRCGVKPKPFRSRLLMLVPVGLAIYMFAWPVIVREVMRPLLMDAQGKLPNWMGQIDPLPGVRGAFLVQDFWATFASWYVAIPFILVCAAVTVYFLGAKAFCTYGCPYGGIFGPVDLLAPGRIRVTDACEHCGHCTAVCTSNVRVHEEVRDYGMVVDPGCMKCMDCVSVCPNDALYIGLGMPAILAKVRPGAEDSAAQAKALKQARFDLTWPEEIVALGLFVILFLCYRGMLNQVPMLMAVAMGGLGAWAVLKSWRLLRDANLRVHGFILKQRGRLRPWGAAFMLATLVCVTIAGWSGYVRLTLARAQLAYQRIDTPVENVLRLDYEATSEETHRARAALELYRKGSPPGVSTAGPGGGVALFWPLTADERINIAYLHLIVGDFEMAERSLEEAVRVGHPTDSLVFQLGQIKQFRAQREASRRLTLGATEAEARKVFDDAQADITKTYQLALARHDHLFGVRAFLLGSRPPSDAAAIRTEWESALRRHPRSIEGHLAAASFLVSSHDAAAARAELDLAIAQRNPTPDQLLQAAQIAFSLPDAVRGAELAQRAADAGMKLPGPRAAAAQLLAHFGEPEKARALADRAVALAQADPQQGGRLSALLGAGHTLNGLGKPELGIPLIRQAMDLPWAGGWEQWRTGKTLIDGGMQFTQAGADAVGRQLIAEGVKLMEKGRDALPLATPIRHELAQVYVSVGKQPEALADMKLAAELAPSNWYLADQYAHLLEDSREVNEGARWHEIARQRARDAAPASH